jgi:flagellar biosynthetic protein FliP
LRFPNAAALRTLQTTGGLISRAWNWFRERQQARADTRRLHVAATASLGEKRFVAVIEMDGLRFLVGGGATNVVLLAELKGKEPFADLLHETMADAAQKPPARSRRQAAKPAMMPGVEQREKRTTRHRTKPPMEAALGQVASMAAERPSKPKAVAQKVRPPQRVIAELGSQTAQPLQMPALKIRQKRNPRLSQALASTPESVGNSAARPAFRSEAPRSVVANAVTEAFPILASEEIAKPILVPPLSRPVKRKRMQAAGTAMRAALRPAIDMASKRIGRPTAARNESPPERATAKKITEALFKKSRQQFRRVLSAIRTMFCLSVFLAAPSAQASSWAVNSGARGINAAQLLRASAALVVVPMEPNSKPPEANELRITGLGGGSAQWTIVVLLTFLTLIPSILICMTPFARLLIVFHFLRQALGLQTTPSNQTLVGLAVIMTFFLMQPIGESIYKDAVVPLQAGQITALDALARGAVPMRQFMAHYVREKDVALFIELAKEPRPANVNDVSFRVLLPAYILSELKAGFQIGAVLFLPFLVVDMVVASITTSVGMMQLPPVVISTPLKLLLFLMVDGWHLLIGALMRSFN